MFQRSLLFLPRSYLFHGGNYLHLKRLVIPMFAGTGAHSPKRHKFIAITLSYFRHTMFHEPWCSLNYVCHNTCLRSGPHVHMNPKPNVSDKVRTFRLSVFCFDPTCFDSMQIYSMHSGLKLSRSKLQYSADSTLFHYWYKLGFLILVPFKIFIFMKYLGAILVFQILVWIQTQKWHHEQINALWTRNNSQVTSVVLL